MLVGVPKEIKNREKRVSITPAGVIDLVKNGNKVIVEKGAGEGSGFSDKSYINAGAQIVNDPAQAWSADMVVKVKEPLQEEYKYFRDGLILFTYLHLAADEKLTRELIKTNVISIAYEMVSLPNNTLPLLAPMSEVAGRVGALIGANLLATEGKGKLISGVPGVKKANATVIGGGVAGISSANLLIGMGADVTVLDTNLQRLRYLDDTLGSKLKTLYSNTSNIRESVINSDIVIGSVLIPGAQAPYLVTESMIKEMEPGSVLVDIAIDQGGCFETSKVTTHENPTYKTHNIVHYSVANIPGLVPMTSTPALTNATLKYVLAIANKGFKSACKTIPELLMGVSTFKGKLTCNEVSKTFNLEFSDKKSIF